MRLWVCYTTVAGLVLAIGIRAIPAYAQTEANRAISPMSAAANPVPLADRVGPAPKAFFDLLELPKAKSLDLTAEDRRKVAEALEYLTPLQKRVLTERLNRISFVEGMPNNALTYSNPDDPTKRTENITIRAGVLQESVSQLVTKKEASCYDPRGSKLSVVIDAGTMPALVYVLLHEATHVVDSSLGLMSDEKSAPFRLAAHTDLTAGIWISRLEAVAAYRIPLLEKSCYRVHGETQPISDAVQVYKALAQTPFASLYGSNNWHDDLAELVAWYDLTQRLHQPYRIVVLEAGKAIYSYEPMNSPLVRQRFPAIAFFYETSAPA